LNSYRRRRTGRESLGSDDQIGHDQIDCDLLGAHLLARAFETDSFKLNDLVQVSCARLLPARYVPTGVVDDSALAHDMVAAARVASEAVESFGIWMQIDRLRRFTRPPTSKAQMRMWRVQRILTNRKMAKGEVTLEQVLQDDVDTVGMEPTSAFVEIQRDSMNATLPRRETIGEMTIPELGEAYTRQMGAHYSL